LICGRPTSAAHSPIRLPYGIQLVFDVLKDSKGAAPAQLLQAYTDPESAKELLGGGKAARLFEGAYRVIIGLPRALEGAARWGRPGLLG
jgi:protein-tyrosine phosphatase